MPIPEALFIATIGSAEVMGMADQIGSLEPGYLADIILVDLSGMQVRTGSAQIRIGCAPQKDATLKIELRTVTPPTRIGRK